MITQAYQAHPDLSVQRLCDRIEEIILECAGYGYRRVTHALARDGWRVNHQRVLRIMQEESLLCHLKKRFVMATTHSRHRFPVYPNVLAGMVLERPDQAWVADLTSIRLPSRVCVPGLYAGCVFPSLCWLVSLP